MFSGCNRQENKISLGLSDSTTSSATLAKEEVRTTPILSLNLPQTIKLTGSLAADEISNIAARQGGIVSEIFFERGQTVKQGDILLKFDPVIANNNLAQAQTRATEIMARLGLTKIDEEFDPSKQPDVKSSKAQLDFAQRDYERDKALLEKKVIAPGDFDISRRQYTTALENYELAVSQARQLYQTLETAKVAIKISRQVVEDLSVKAPYDGVITERTASLGQSVRDLESIGGIAKINPIRVRLSVHESAVSSIAPGQKVLFTVSSFPKEQFEGTIKYISPVLDETRTLIAEAVADNPDNKLKPGLFSMAEIIIEDNQDIILVPKTAIKKMNDTARVFVLRDGKAVEEMVILSDRETSGLVQIKGNIQSNESVVIKAAEVTDGLHIQ